MIRAGRKTVAVAVCLLGLASGAARAQVPTQISPGAIGNENQRRQQQLENQTPAPQTAPQNAPVTGPGAPSGGNQNAVPDVSFPLRSVDFDPSQFLTKDELNDIARPFIGRTVNFKDLSELVQKINELYGRKGQITARAVLPPQNIRDGAVHIALIEGKLGKIGINNAMRVREDFVRTRIPAQAGDTVDAAQLVKHVVYFNRTNDVQLRATLKPGSAFGTTDIDVSLTEPPANIFQLFADNYGVESTGRWEGGVYFRHNDLLGVDDRLMVYGTASGGFISGSASYSLPFDTDGDRFSVSYDRNHIDIINGQFQGLGITGDGQTGTIGVSHPLLATERWLVLANASGSVGTSTTVAPSGPVADTQTYRVNLGASGTYIGSDFLASLSPSFVFAHSLNNILASDRDITMFLGSGSAIVPFGDSWSMHFAAAWQFAQQKLLPADLLFQIGGPTSVRGYASGTFAGDSGFYTNLEMHKSFNDVLQGLDLFAAYDAGMIFSTIPAERSIQSIAMGAGLGLPSGFKLNAGVGIPLNQASPDQDGALAYLQLTVSL